MSLPSTPQWGWGDDHGVTWENADEETKERFAAQRLYWFYRMVQCGGPDGSDLDAETDAEAKEAADWLGPLLARRAGIASDGDL